MCSLIEACVVFSVYCIVVV